ncbi:PilX N-terminal domain-containing pilus assembly protein [Desulfurivibrio sp. D14AmB]|uniref:PilX N-terminal domain-containing pilus assembly protein n=1 Tax=Desulfurivibrio sp. D14AmB TaxID=3374370 RepID=UPI00376EBE7A
MKTTCQKTGDLSPRRGNTEEGFVLVGALLIMLILVLIGISATTSTNLEMQIAGTERAHAEAFTQADAGLEMATLLLEENIACAGFSGPGDRLIGPIRVFDDARGFWENQAVSPNPGWSNPPPPAVGWGWVRNFLDTDPEQWEPTDWIDWAGWADSADFVMADLLPGDPWDDPRRGTSVMLGGETRLAVGGAMQMAAGYAGVGKGVAAGGGAALVYDLYVQQRGARNAVKLLEVRWRHSIGQEGNCRDAQL